MLAHAIVKFVGSAVLLAGCAAPSRPPAQPATAAASAAPASPAAHDFGVLIMAHGGSPQWNEAVLDAVRPLRGRYDIEVAFGMADAASLQDSVAKLEARHVRKIGVVRMFISGESFLTETEQIFGLRPGAPPVAATPSPHAGHAGHSMAFHRVATQSSFALSAQGLSDAAGMATILADRVAALSKTPAQEDVLILAHGPGDDAENARWLAKLDARAAGIRARAAFRRVQVETLREDWPDKRAAAEARVRAFVRHAHETGGTALVIPFRLQGFGPYAEVLEGLDYVADHTGLLPHPAVTEWIDHEITALEAGPFRAPLPAE